MSEENLEQTVAALAKSVGERAENLYLTRQLLCSEAVLSVVNRGLGGGVADDVAIRMASALPIGIGDSGCTCGALSGAVLALGLFLGRDRPSASDSKGALLSAKVLYGRFKELFGSSCCRVLSKDVKHDPALHFQHCARLTAQAAELVTLIILDKRPELVRGVDKRYVETRDTWLGSKLSALFR